MKDLKKCDLKKIGYPSDHPIDLNQVAHDLAIAKTTREITPDDEETDIYYRYYYNFAEFEMLFKILEKEKLIEVPILKEIKP